MTRVMMIAAMLAAASPALAWPAGESAYNACRWSKQSVEFCMDYADRFDQIETQRWMDGIQRQNERLNDSYNRQWRR